jgi:hypothetical protein
MISINEGCEIVYQPEACDDIISKPTLALREIAGKTSCRKFSLC